MQLYDTGLTTRHMAQTCQEFSLGLIKHFAVYFYNYIIAFGNVPEMVSIKKYPLSRHVVTI